MNDNKKPSWKERLSNRVDKIDPLTLSTITLGISCFSFGFSLGVLLSLLLR